MFTLKSRVRAIVVRCMIGLMAICSALTMFNSFAQESAKIDSNPITIVAGFAGNGSISPDEPIELTLSRVPKTSEGRLAIIIGAADLTDLFVVGGNSLKYVPRQLPLPMGDSELTVYLVTPGGEWKEIAQFPLKVAVKAGDGSPTAAVANSDQAAASETASQTEPATAGGDASGSDPAQAGTATQATPEAARRRFGFDKFEMTPQLNIGVKSQFAETHFPETNKPDRPRFTDATISGTWKSEMERGTMKMEQQFDIVGSSFRNEALRFAQLGANANKIDLSSYLMQFQQGARKFTLGHSTFGQHRHLVNNFSSRGMTLTVPINSHLDLSMAAINSTNIVGFENFFGIKNSRHRMFSGIIGFEVFGKRPGGLRFETGVSDAWFLSNRTNFNEGNINDSERSRGLSFRMLAKNKSERARIDAGFTRSQFVNPDDPLLNQDAVNVVRTRRTTRNARYVEVGFDLLKDFSFARAKTPAATVVADGAAQTSEAQASQALPDPKKLSLTLNVKHERVDPLFRSIGAAAQADLEQDIVELVGVYGDLGFTAAHTRFNDNLGGIRTILRTNTQRTVFALTTPLQNLLSKRPPVTPNPFLPRIGYTFEQVRASADFIPIGGGFDQPGAIPDQANINQAITAEWQFKDFRASYRLNHTLQDNRAIGRERADLQNFIHTASLGWNPKTTLELSFDVNFEDANNRELINTDRNLRFGFAANWQATQHQTFSAVFATVGAGDLRRTNNSRNVEFDFQWNYKLARESENKFKKVQTIYFIRYSNRYARTRNLIEEVNNLTRLNTFNTGLNFIFF